MAVTGKRRLYPRTLVRDEYAVECTATSMADFVTSRVFVATFYTRAEAEEYARLREQAHPGRELRRIVRRPAGSVVYSVTP